MCPRRNSRISKICCMHASTCSNFRPFVATSELLLQMRIRPFAAAPPAVLRCCRRALSWSPDRYAAFAAERLRPAADLLARVPSLASSSGSGPPSIVDVGAGTGAAAGLLLERWPDAKLLLLDSSSEMLSAARAALDGRPGVSFAAADFEEFFSGEPQTPRTRCTPTPRTFHAVHRSVHAPCVAQASPPQPQPTTTSPSPTRPSTGARPMPGSTSSHGSSAACALEARWRCSCPTRERSPATCCCSRRRGKPSPLPCRRPSPRLRMRTGQRRTATRSSARCASLQR